MSFRERSFQPRRKRDAINEKLIALLIKLSNTLLPANRTVVAYDPRPKLTHLYRTPP